MKKPPAIFRMYSYLSFVEYLRRKQLSLEWNDETKQYEVFELLISNNYGTSRVLLTTIPKEVVRRKYDEAVEAVEAALELNRLFLHNTPLTTRRRNRSGRV